MRSGDSRIMPNAALHRMQSIALGSPVRWSWSSTRPSSPPSSLQTAHLPRWWRVSVAITAALSGRRYLTRFSARRLARYVSLRQPACDAASATSCIRAFAHASEHVRRCPDPRGLGPPQCEHGATGGRGRGGGGQQAPSPQYRRPPAGLPHSQCRYVAAAVTLRGVNGRPSAAAFFRSNACFCADVCALRHARHRLPRALG